MLNSGADIVTPDADSGLCIDHPLPWYVRIRGQQVERIANGPGPVRCPKCGSHSTVGYHPPRGNTHDQAMDTLVKCHRLKFQLVMVQALRNVGSRSVRSKLSTLTLGVYIRMTVTL